MVSHFWTFKPFQAIGKAAASKNSAGMHLEMGRCPTPPSQDLGAIKMCPCAGDDSNVVSVLSMDKSRVQSTFS